MRLGTTSPTAGGLFRDGGSGVATRPVEILLRTFRLIEVLRRKTSPDRLGFIEAVVAVVVATHASGWSPGCRLVIEVSGATGLLCGNATQANALVGEEHRCARQQELPELENGIESPALKEQDPATQKTDGSEENVVVAGERRFESCA